MKYLGLVLGLSALLAFPLELPAKEKCRNGVCRDRGAVRPPRGNRPPARVVRPAPTRPRNPRANRPTPTRPRNPGLNRPAPRPRNPGYRPAPTRPRNPGANRPPRVRPPRYDYDRRPDRRRVIHRPIRVDRRPRVVYRSPRDYYRSIPYRNLYRNRWIRISISYNDGYFFLDGRPYYVYNGYRHRYTPVEICDYELVDGRTNTTYQTFYGQTCTRGYDNCAELRDDLNWYEYDDRYFCAERFFDDPYRY